MTAGPGYPCHSPRLLLVCVATLQGSSNSYAIKKKDEIERVAKANR